MTTVETKPWHPGLNYAGTNHEWLPTDTKESYERLIQEPQHLAYFEQQGWTQPGAITYNINQDGFRSPALEPGTNCMIALGCSFTMGTGLPVSTTWPILVGQRLSLKVYNLAWPGISADTCYRLARYWIAKLKPKAVAMLVPPRNRIELLMYQGCQPPAEVFIPASQSRHFNPDDVFLKNWWTNEQNGEINCEKNILAIKQICLDNEATFVWLFADQEMCGSREELGYARDYMHAGPMGHRMVAEKMLKELTWP